MLYWKKIDLCLLILYISNPVILAYYFQASFFFFLLILWYILHRQPNYLQIKKTYSYLVRIAFFFLSVELPKTSSIILNRVAKEDMIALLLVLGENCSVPYQHV